MSPRLRLVPEKAATAPAGRLEDPETWVLRATLAADDVRWNAEIRQARRARHARAFAAMLEGVAARWALTWEAGPEGQPCAVLRPTPRALRTPGSRRLLPRDVARLLPAVTSYLGGDHARWLDDDVGMHPVAQRPWLMFVTLSWAEPDEAGWTWRAEAMDETLATTLRTAYTNLLNETAARLGVLPPVPWFRPDDVVTLTDAACVSMVWRLPETDSRRALLDQPHLRGLSRAVLTDLMEPARIATVASSWDRMISCLTRHQAHPNQRQP